MEEKLQIEYPTQDVSTKPPAFISAAPAGLTKREKRILNAQNRIVYCRALETIDQNELYREMSVYGQCQVFIIKKQPPFTAFCEYQTPDQCSRALAAKVMGCNLPRHKRVDFKLAGGSEDGLIQYLQGCGDIKTVCTVQDICTIEFLAALGAAQAIVRCKKLLFNGHIIEADYSPTIKEDTSEDYPPNDSSHLKSYESEYFSGIVDDVNEITVPTVCYFPENSQ
jgi:hypothetical protein